MAGPYIWQEMRREEFPPLAEQGAMVVVPTGSTEQHGLHCPVGTDIINAFHIAVGVSKASDQFPVIVAPPLWVGMSPHHKIFPGVITLGLETYGRVIRDICASIAHGGFDRIALLNGHGGNRGLLQAACLELRAESGIGVADVSYWVLIPDVLEEISEREGASIGHAGELETSLLLYLQEHLVDMGRLELVPGISDDPSIASKAKGKRMYEAAVERMAEYLREWRAADKLRPPRL